MNKSDEVTMTDSQTFYYLDSNFQLELNIRYMKQQLLKILEVVEEIGCFVCDRIKCCCDGKQTDTKDDGDIIFALDKDKSVEVSVTKAIDKELEADEVENGDNNVDSEDSVEEDGYVTAKDATCEDSNTDDDDDSDIIDDPHEHILRAPIMASSPFEYLLSPKSPPAQTLPRPQFNATKDNQIDQLTDVTKIDNEYKETDDWIKEMMDKEFAKDVKENTMNTMNISWPGALANWGGIEKVNTPVENFFRNFTQQPHTPMQATNSQTVLFTSSFMSTMRLQHRSPYM